MRWRDILAKLTGGSSNRLEADLRRSDPEAFEHLQAGAVDRRSFLRLAGAAVAAMGVDPEALIWTPGRQIAVPGPEPVRRRGNYLITPEEFERDFLRLYEKNLTIGDRIHRGYDYSIVGGHVSVQIPMRFAIRTS